MRTATFFSKKARMPISDRCVYRINVAVISVVSEPVDE